MPDGLVFGGPFAVPPSSADERIRMPLERGQPEEIHGLSWRPPNFADLEHKIICSFAISRKKRPNLDCVPCAICSGKHPKFLEGAVLWSSDGWLRVIGHVCAAKPEHFGVARYRKLQKARAQEQLDSLALEWLQAHIAHFELLLESIEGLRKVALFLENQQKVLFHNLPSLALMLENIARRQGGILTVAQELSGTRLMATEFSRSTGTLQDQYELIRVGVLEGTQFLIRPRQKRSRKLESIKQALELIPKGNGEQPILDLIDQGGEHQITIATGIAFRALQRASKLADECVDAIKFLQAESLATLEQWGADLRNTQNFILQKLGSRVTFVLSDRSRAALSMEWPRMPDLEMLRRIVSSGLALDGLLPRGTSEDL